MANGNHWADRALDVINAVDAVFRIGKAAYRLWLDVFPVEVLVRRPFNTSCDLFEGPGGAVPGSFIGTFACRLVYQDGIQDYSLWGNAPTIPYWLTIQDRVPRGMFYGPGMQLDSDLGDRVAVPSGSSPRFAVFYTDVIKWKDQATYYRGYLVALPLPDYLQGGILLGGAAIIVPPAPVTAGGVHCGGSAHISIGRFGGVLLGGIAMVKPPAVTSTSGGVLLGGIALVKPPAVTSTSGGVLLGGTAPGTFTPGGFESGTIASVEGPGGSGGFAHNVIHTSAPQSVVTGSVVTVAGVTNLPALNGSWTVTHLSSTVLQLDGASSAGGGPFTESSATWVQTA